MTAELCKVLVADVPWKFGDRLPGKGRGAEKHYPCMSTSELMRFPLPEMAADSMLVFWKVAAMPQDALDIVRAWGFTPKAEIVWVKTTGRVDLVSIKTLQKLFAWLPGDKSRGWAKAVIRSIDALAAAVHLAFGMGRYVRNCHEVAIVCTRGRFKVKSRSIRSVFFAPRGRHSAKPDAFYELVEALADGPYVELFARRERAGWTTLGNEIPQHEQLEAAE